MITRTLEIAGIESGFVQLTPSQVTDLDSRVSGPILQVGDEGWDDAVLIWNAMWTQRPALVVQPTSAQDVAAAVSFARENGLLISVKGGGHNIAGAAIADNGLMIDMSRMREVVVDPAAKLVQVGGGCLLGDVDQATQKYGLATVMGLVSEVGVGGLTLGGGFGNLCRRFGWAVDNIEEVEIVTADGAIRNASRTENPDLFWAIRGGGGNFGVVTRFTFRLHEVGPVIHGGLLAWGANRAPDVIDAYRQVTESAPRELLTGMIVSTVPAAPFVPAEFHGLPMIGVLVCHTGQNPEADIAPLRKVGNPAADLIADRPYVEQQCLLNDMEPKGFNQYWKAEYLPELSSEYLATTLDSGLRLTSPHSYTITLQLGGAIGDRDADDGAVGNRDAAFIGGIAAMWEDDDRDAEHIAWAREAWQKIRPFSTGGNYVNFQMPDDDSTRTAAAYGTNFDRLRQIKSEWDPYNLFRTNRNITPESVLPA
jgi:FAD/FMN-containing dehydrogenase